MINANHARALASQQSRTPAKKRDTLLDVLDVKIRSIEIERLP